MADLTFKQKLFRTLYDFGLKNFGGELLVEFKRGSAEWVAFADALMKGSDYKTRKVLLKQIMNRKFLEKSKQKDALIEYMIEFMTAKNAIGDEKKNAIKFVEQNLNLFPGEDDRFRGAILSLSRDSDRDVSALANLILPKIGIDMDDPALYRRH